MDEVQIRSLCKLDCLASLMPQSAAIVCKDPLHAWWYAALQQASRTGAAMLGRIAWMARSSWARYQNALRP